MNMKKRLLISGATLVAGLTLGVGATTTAHAMTYQEAQQQYYQWAGVDTPEGIQQARQDAVQDPNGSAHKFFDQNGNLRSLRDIAQSDIRAKAFLDQVDGGSNSVASNGTTSGATSTGVASSNNSVATNNGNANNKPVYVATKDNSGLKTLPQTGNNNGEAVTATGVGLASLVSMFGLAGLKRRFG